MIIKSKALRDAARGEECTLRLDCCSFDPEQTVLAHLPTGRGGMGLKAADTVAVFACMNCHDVLDGRTAGIIEADDLLRALDDTHVILIRKGILTVKGLK